MNPVLSIVVPTLNQGPYIEMCLRSILDQSFRDLEVIIQDAGSNDETESICRRIAAADSRVAYCREADRGQSDALNRGLVRSRGRYWTWLCSDDALENPQVYTELVGALEGTDERVVGAYAQARFANAEMTPIRPHPLLDRDVKLEDYKHHWPFAQPSSILKRELVLSCGALDEKLHLGMDLDLFIRLLRVRPQESSFRFVPVAGALIREHEGSKTTSLAKRTMRQAMAIQRKYFGTSAYLLRTVYMQVLIDLLLKEYWEPVRPGFLKR